MKRMLLSLIVDWLRKFSRTHFKCRCPHATLRGLPFDFDHAQLRKLTFFLLPSGLFCIQP
jgi:hypothetical protein